MASTFSTNLAIELIGTGDQAGTWGVTTNTNLGTLIEQAISGYVTQAVSTGADTTITIPNGATGVARNMYIELTGTGGTNTNLIVPSNKKLYFIFNNTASGQVTVKVSGQTGVSVPNGKKVVLVCNGTDIVNGLNYIADFGTNSFTVTNLTATSATITNLIATTASISDASATVLRSASATITNLIATSASITTLTNNPTFSAGTANGVLYLNGSKVATSGSALTFDGTTVLTTPRINVTNTGTGATFSSSGGSGLKVYGASGTNQWDIYLNGANVRFSDNTGGGAVKIDTNAIIDGNVGIGTASPVAKLDVQGILAISNSSLSYWGIDRDNSSGALTFSDSTTQRLELTTSGNLGLGVTPNAWLSSFRAMQLGQGSSLWGAATGNNAGFDSNVYVNTSGGSIYVGSTFATRYQQNDGTHKWYTAPSGTAGNAISFTQAMTLNASSQLLVNQTASGGSAAKLQVGGANGSTNAGAIFAVEKVNEGYGLYVGVEGSGASFIQAGTANDSTYYNLHLQRNGGNVGIGTTSPGERLNVIGGGLTTSTVNFTGGSGNDNATIASDYSLVFQVDANNNVGGRAFNWRYGGKGYSDGTSLMTLDSSGNLGLGVAPSAWSIRALQVGSGFAAWSTNVANARIFANTYYDGAYKYMGNGRATQYEQDGYHAWYLAANNTSGAGAAIPTWTQAMTLDANGVLFAGAVDSVSSGVRALFTGSVASVPVVKIDGVTANGFTLLGDHYGADESIVTLGLSYSSGATIIGNTVAPSTSNDTGFISTQDTYACRGAAIRLDGGAGVISFWNSNTSSTVTTGSARTLTQAMTLTAGGDLLVGTTTAANARLVSYCASAQDVIRAYSPDGAGNTYSIFAGFHSGPTLAVNITTNGNITNINGSYGTISDAKMKTDIVDAGSQWADMKAVRFRKFKMKDDPTGLMQLGVVAQELEQVSPGLVDEHPDRDAEGNDLGTTTKSVKTSVLLMKAAKALQEAMARIESLEADVAALKGAK